MVASSDLSDCWPLVRSGLTPAAGGQIHVPFAGRSNPISERLVMLAAGSALPEQSEFHYVTILLCDGMSAAVSPKAIKHLCSFAGQLGLQSARLHVPPAFTRVEAGRTVFVFGTLQYTDSTEHYGDPPSRPSLRLPALPQQRSPLGPWRGSPAV